MSDTYKIRLENVVAHWGDVVAQWEDLVTHWRNVMTHWGDVGTGKIWWLIG